MVLEFLYHKKTMGILRDILGHLGIEYPTYQIILNQKNKELYRPLVKPEFQSVECKWTNQEVSLLSVFVLH